MSDDTLDKQIPDRSPLNIKSTAIRFGIIGGMGCVLVSVGLFLADLQFENWARWIGTLVLILAVIFGIKAIAAENERKSKPFGSLFGAGMLITLIIALISIFYFFLYLNFIETDFAGKVLEVSRQQMMEKGLNEDQIDKALEMTRKFTSPWIMAVFALIANLFFGTIGSLIGAAIFKEDK